jgi:hypothetical protein
METLLEGPCEMPYFTDLRLVFRAIGDRQREYNWLLTDVECNWLGIHDGRRHPLPDSGPYWLTGSELSRIVAEFDMQFVWGVLSGFPSAVSLHLDRLDVEPYADGNPDFWAAQPRIQHPLAEVEIACWDSTSTLLLSRDQSISESFRRYFPEAVDLPAHNRARENRNFSD